MRTHKRYFGEDESELQAVCNNGLFVQGDLTTEDHLVTCGNCRRIAGLRPLPPAPKVASPEVLATKDLP